MSDDQSSTEHRNFIVNNEFVSRHNDLMREFGAQCATHVAACIKAIEDKLQKFSENVVFIDLNVSTSLAEEVKEHLLSREILATFDHDFRRESGRISVTRFWIWTDMKALQEVVG